MSVDILLPDNTKITGAGPLILLGPNGVGKSRLANRMAQQFGYDRVPALRSLDFGSSLPLWREKEAKQNVDNQINQTKNNTWQLANEVGSLLGELKAEDARAATTFRDEWEVDNSTKPQVTNLKKLARLWKIIFPGRELDLSTYEPTVRATITGRDAAPYAAHQMSDGERAAVYLIARALRANPGVVIIDEPEVHFHALLARTFWDVIEGERGDCRFVYITHDIPFALSRRNARIAIVKNEREAALIAEDDQIPADLYESILGATSLSMVSKRVVFCEGKNGRSIDPHLYGAWFQTPETVVVPVGSCLDVERCVRSYALNPISTGSISIGLVDLDYTPGSKIEQLRSAGIFALPANEAEGLLCLKPIVAAVLTHMGMSAQIENIYAQFENEMRNQAKGVFLNKQILERAKKQIDAKIIALTNGANPDNDRSITRSNLINEAQISRLIPDVGSLFDTIATETDVAVGSGAHEFLKYLPGKTCFGTLCRIAGIATDTYVSLVTKALSQPNKNGDPTFEQLRVSLVSALTPLLPPR